MIHFRYAKPTDVQNLSPLLLEVSYCLQFLYGSTYKPQDVEKQLQMDFLQEKGKSTYKNCYLAEKIEDQTSEIMGVACFYDYRLHKVDDTLRKAFNPQSVEVLEPLYDSIMANSLYISALIINEKARSLGIGAQLITEIKKIARTQGLSHVCLHVWEDNQRGIEFYKRNNFQFQETVIFDTDSSLLPPSKMLHLYGVEVL